ncbi:methyl-CpG-binding domain-containing protein 13-like isoform X1 [Cucurbita moschata]|uniref:Methyl-CpG-binding domain-containing protein 13-like isoform X1 n=2 Tax=Cucurbita moschata TaxID=3662 RepID=A0A6J1EAU0_CUCMO|nr:methyl-CpG-binding domain-containing protein 13-like isoform X1 [Cucurbita moschata]
MMNQNSENWLPPGWTVKVKVRKSGKKDKYYFEPSSQMRFNSRAEVFRYLKTPAINHPESEGSRTVEQPENNVEVKKTIAKGLPPGWIREIRVTRTANRIRRDSFYINPVNGNALRSLRDVHRYLTSGKVSRLAYKSRSQSNSNSNSNIEFQHDDISSPSVSEKEMLAIGKAKRQIIWSDNSPEPSEIVDDEAIFPKAASVGERMPFLKPNLTHGRIGAKLHCSTPEEAKEREQSEGKNNFSDFVPTPDKSFQHKCTSENGATKIESRKRQRKSKDINLRCRASKRLAGLQAEPVLEAKTGHQACSIACEESDKQVASTTKWPSQSPENPDVKHETKSIIDPPKIDTNLDSSRKEHSAVDLSILPEKVKKMKSEDAYELQQPKCNSFLPSEDVLEKHVGQVESDDKADVKKQGTLLKLPMEDLLTDPCIAFAVKTLTGDVFDASISSEASLMPNNIDRPFVAFTHLESENKLNEKLPSPELPVTRVGKVENNNIVEKLDSTLKLPVGEIWADPCIEFAIKTLTGEIPLVNNPDIEDYFHQFAPSKTEGTNANASNHVGSY